MPLKVVPGGAVPANGEINRTDLDQMMTEFKTQVALNRSSAQVIKYAGWYVSKEEIDRLFMANTGQTQPVLLLISFAVTPAGVTDICGYSLGDSLTVVLQATNTDKEPVNSSNEYILIPGYKNEEINLGTTNNKASIRDVFGAVCCPSQKPPPDPITS